MDSNQTLVEVSPTPLREPISRSRIRGVFLRNGFRIEDGRDDLPDWIYESVFELLELAAPAVQGEPTDDELLEWAGEEQFFLFCDEDEFLQIARSVIHKYGRRGAAVQGEPVAWQLRAPDERVILNKEFPAWADGVDGYKITPLYAAPQPLVGRTVAMRYPENSNTQGWIRGTVVGVSAESGDILCEIGSSLTIGDLPAEQQSYVTQLVEELEEARDLVDSWAAYASDYFKEKHNLARDLERLDAVIAAHRKQGGGE